jgi:hypothetical protein
MIVKKGKPYTNDEKASALTRCFWWFVGLLVFNIATFWVPFVRACTSRGGEADLMGWILMVGMATNCLLSSVLIYKFARILGTRYVWMLWILAAIFPLTAPIAFLLLCNRAFKELSRLNSRMTLHLSRIGAGFSSVLLLLAAGMVIFVHVQEISNHEQLKKSGMPITGILQMVTKHYVNLIPSGYSFTIDYAGRSKTFTADGKLFQENTLPDGKFTHHEIALIYLPDHPEVAELAGGSPSILTGLLIGGLMALLGGSGLYAAIKNKFAKDTRGRSAPGG